MIKNENGSQEMVQTLNPSTNLEFKHSRPQTAYMGMRQKLKEMESKMEEQME